MFMEFRVYSEKKKERVTQCLWGETHFFRIMDSARLVGLARNRDLEQLDYAATEAYFVLKLLKNFEMNMISFSSAH